MKKLIIALALFAATAVAAFGQQSVAQVDDHTFRVERKAKAANPARDRQPSYVPTDTTLVDGDSTYRVYRHTFSRGQRAGQQAFFVRRTSRKGNPYWKEITLPAVTSRTANTNR